MFEFQVDCSVPVPVKNIGLQFESASIIKGVLSDEFWRHSDKVVTWSPLLSGPKYVKHLHPTCVTLHEAAEVKSFSYTMIAANKFNLNSKLPGYDVRMKIINYAIEKGIDFKLFGRLWDESFAMQVANRFLNRFGLKAFFKTNRLRKVYVSPVRRKEGILQASKFSFAIENTDLYEGYITEKIIDILRCNCVPIYWGNSKVFDYIPSSTFINLKNFSSFDELFRYTDNLSSAEYADFRNEIEAFNKKSISVFSSQLYASSVLRITHEV